MRSFILPALAAAGLTALSSMAMAQSLPEGRVYAFQSPARGGCPPLSWKIVVGPENTLTGIFAWDHEVARGTGKVNMRDRSFEIHAMKEGADAQGATITGKLRQDGWMVSDIKGPRVDCKGLIVQWYVPAPEGEG